MRQRQGHDADKAARSGTVLRAVIITSMAGFMAAHDNLSVTTALPSIRRDLGGGLRDGLIKPHQTGPSTRLARFRPRPPLHPLIG